VPGKQSLALFQRQYPEELARSGYLIWMTQRCQPENIAQQLAALTRMQQTEGQSKYRLACVSSGI